MRTISATETEPRTSPIGSLTTSIGGSPFDLVLSTVTDNPDPVAPGQTLKYTIVAVNAGTQDADPVTIAIQLPNPAATTFENADGSNGFNCTAPTAAGLLTCQGPLPAGGDTVISVTVTVLLGAVPPPDLTLTATIDPTSPALPNGNWAEANEGNNTETEVTTVSGTTCFNCVDLVTTALTANPGVVGSETTITARVVNVGDQSTALDGTTQPLVRLQVVAVSGGFSIGTPTFSDPAFAPLCTATTSPLVAPFVLYTLTCTGNLGPSAGLTINVPVTSITGDFGVVWQADPNNLLNAASTPPEFREDNNLLIITILKLF